MKLLDFLDRRFRAVFIAAISVSAFLYLAGLTTASYAIAAANGTIVLIQLLRASRDTSRGSFPDAP